MRIAGFFSCKCGKVHCYGGLWRSSTCSCGEKLYFYAITRA